MATDNFLRRRLEQMIDLLRHPLAVLAQRMPWSQIEAALTPALAHEDRTGTLVESRDRRAMPRRSGAFAVRSARPAWMKAVRPSEFERAIVRHKVVTAAKAAGIALKQTFAREGKALRAAARTRSSTSGCAACSSGNARCCGRLKSNRQRRWLRRRQAIEPAIGHLKADHRMKSNQVLKALPSGR